jgi:hypothetical protein
MSLRYCGLLECNGHLSKYDNCLTEALHESCSAMVGWADEEGGSCDSPYGYRWLILGHDSIEVKAFDWSGGFDIRTVPGTYLIITTTDQGFVYLESFDTADEAKAAYDEFDRLYGIWSEANEYAY